MKPTILKLSLLISLAVLLSSCATYPENVVSREITSAELEGHVRYLASRSLGGRAVFTRGSRLARGYIARAFLDSGLKPAGREGTYFDPFFLGENVVGSIEGSDPELANEVVVLSAHFDHLPKEPWGKWYPGASDNASGVAALIEAAEYTGQLEERLPRTILFVAFEAEETGLLGSHHFLENFPLEGRRIVASVNLDLLGRDFFDCVESTVFAIGTDTSDEMREDLVRLRSSSELDVLFLGSDLVGPIGDSYNFAMAEIPSVMLTSGWHRDYHKPSDTWDKLNYTSLASAARLATDAILALAADADPFTFRTEQAADTEELNAVLKVTTALLENSEEAGFDEDQIAQIKDVKEKAAELASSADYSIRDRESFALTVQQKLFPMFFPDAPAEGFAAAIQFANTFPELLQGAYDEVFGRFGDRELTSLSQVRKVLQNGFSYLGMQIAPNYLTLTPRDDREMLSFILGYLSIKGPEKREKWPALSLGFSVNNFVGEREELIQYFLLRWNYRRGEYRTAQVSVYPELLEFLAEKDYGNDFEGWKRWFLDEHGVSSEEEWVRANLDEPNALCRIAAINNLESYFPDTWRKHCLERALDADEAPIVRWEALDTLEGAGEDLETEVLVELLPLLDDGTFMESENARLTLMEGHPLSGTPLFTIARDLLEKALSEEREKSDSIYRIQFKALRVLQKATRKKYGLERRRWARYLGVQ
jgi:hypothetical protein